MNISVIILIFSGIIATFAPDFWTFSIMRMFIGVSVGGVMVVGFVILMEFVGTEIRDVISALFHLPFTLGHVLLVAFGYFIRDYFYFHLAISLTAVYLFFYICLLPESPRWLLAVNKTTNAITLIERVAKVYVSHFKISKEIMRLAINDNKFYIFVNFRNSLPTEGLSEKILLHQAQITQNQLEKGTIVDLFRKPNLRKNLFIMSFNWFVCGFCYYGVSQYVSHLSGNIFINVAATGGVTVCSIFISIILMKCLGRKTVVIISSILCGTCLLIMAIVPEGSLSIVFGCIGNLCCFITFIMVYLFCSEMFPTVVRNAALGICSTMARVGGMIAPFIVGLKYYSSLYPPILFGALPLIAAVLCMFLPETKNCELMTTIEEGENFAKRV